MPAPLTEATSGFCGKWPLLCSVLAHFRPLITSQHAGQIRIQCCIRNDGRFISVAFAFSHIHTFFVLVPQTAFSPNQSLPALVNPSWRSLASSRRHSIIPRSNWLWGKSLPLTYLEGAAWAQMILGASSTHSVRKLQQGCSKDCSPQKAEIDNCAAFWALCRSGNVIGFLLSLLAVLIHSNSPSTDSFIPVFF